MLAIELNDVGIIAVDGTTVLLESPGYALIGPQRVLVGRAAHQQARLHPRQIHHRFWVDLGTAQLPHPYPHVNSHADLACAHLAHVWDQLPQDAEGVVFAVPGSFSKEQLGLLLGIARELSIPVTGMVDAAMAAIPRPFPARKLLHLDVQLHRMTLTHFEQGEQLTRGRVEILDQGGLVSLQDAWVKVIADTFVRATRFDPFHLAATEQELYARLPGWLEALQQRPVTALEMQAGGKVYRISVTSEQLARATGIAYDQVAARLGAARRMSEGTALQVAHRLSNFPGLLDRLRQLPDCEVSTLDPDAAARGALRHREVIGSDRQTVVFVAELPWTGEAGTTPRPTPPPPVPSAGARPTHILYQGLAYPVGSLPLVIGRDIPSTRSGITIANSSAGISRVHCSIISRGHELLLEDHSTFGTFVNEQRVDDRAVLRIGDTVRIGSPGEELQVILVVPPDEA